MTRSHVCARSVGDAGSPGLSMRTQRGRESRGIERAMQSTYAGEPGERKREREREMRREEGEKGEGEEAVRSSRPRCQLPTDLSNGTCRSGAMSFCTFLLSRLVREQRLAERAAKSPAGLSALRVPPPS